MSSVYNYVVHFITTNSNYRVEEINSGIHIVESGIISSILLVELVSSLERDFDITFEPEDMDEQNFSLIGKFCDFVEGKIAAA